MAYAPGISYTGGESIARGIETAAASLAGALIQRAEKRKQKEEWAAATAKLQPLVDRLAPDSGIKLDQDTPKELVPQLIQVAGTLERETREKPLRDIQLENERLRLRLSQGEIDTAAKNAEALGAAGRDLTPQVDFPAALRRDAQGRPPPMRAPNPSAALATYLNRGGTDPRMLAQLGDLAQTQLKNSNRTPPGLQSFGADAWGRPVQGLVDAQGNVSRIAPPTDRDVAQPFQIGGQTFYKVGSDILNSEGVPVKAPGAPKQLDPFAAQALHARYQDILEQAAPEPNAGFFESKETATARTAKLREQANFLAQQLGYAAPFPAAGTAPQAAAPTAEQPAARPAKPAKPAPLPYSASDIQAELKRRGLAK